MGRYRSSSSQYRSAGGFSSGSGSSGIAAVVILGIIALVSLLYHAVVNKNE